MVTDDVEQFHFLPRTEAQAMKWDWMLPPVRKAVFELLVRIEGAILQSKDSKKEDVSTCFLVNGERGTGKTTVLLSAHRAVDQSASIGKDDFWREEGGGTPRTKQDDELRGDALAFATRLREANVVWLPLLDLQPLPFDANLLTTVLTRISAALGPANEDFLENQHQSVRSLLEAGAQGARSQLSRLINDASLMWESIAEQDTRSRANRQIAAADIYSNFRQRLTAAMAKLSGELAANAGHRNQHFPIILPIDNIDRSTGHLNAIVKLVQIVASEHLWLVLAGDRDDVETFLEWAYWKELMRAEGRSIVAGKSGPGEDQETLKMARRQAAAAFQKLVPPSHRVEVANVAPLAVLDYFPPGQLPQRTIRNLLYQIQIPTAPTDEDTPAADVPAPDLRLLDLFDPTDFLAEHSSSSRPRKPTDGRPLAAGKESQLPFAARNALRLPARRVLDLWQVTHSVLDFPHQQVEAKLCVDEEELAVDLRAEKVARSMLRHAIAASALPSSLGHWLQDRVIRRSGDGGTMLVFDVGGGGKPVVEAYPLLAFGFACDLSPLAMDTKETSDDIDLRVHSRFAVQAMQDFLLKIRCPGDEFRGETTEDLPQLVAGWLCVLYDILMLTERVAVVNPPGGIEQLSSRCVLVTHQAFLREHGPGRPYRIRRGAVSLNWPSPQWDTFFAHGLFNMRWRKYLQMDRVEARIGGDNADLLRRLVVFWLASTLDTYACLDPAIHSQHHVADLIKQGKPVNALESAVFGAAGKVYDDIRPGSLQSAARIGCRQGFAVRERELVLRGWLKLKLPLLLSQTFVPLRDSDGHSKIVSPGKPHGAPNDWYSCYVRDLVTPVLGEDWAQMELAILQPIYHTLEQVLDALTESATSERPGAQLKRSLRQWLSSSADESGNGDAESPAVRAARAAVLERFLLLASCLRGESDEPDSDTSV